MTDLRTRIAWLSYKEGLKESQIATMLGLSRSKVGRLLQKAREDGIVHFQVLGPISNCLEIEKKLIDLFDLQDALVVPTVSEDKIRESLGRAAAQYLERHLTNRGLFAVGWGITISEVPKFIHSQNIHNLRIVTLNGGLTPSFYLNPYDVATRLAYIFGGIPSGVKKVKSWLQEIRADEIIPDWRSAERGWKKSFRENSIIREGGG